MTELDKLRNRVKDLEQEVWILEKKTEKMEQEEASCFRHLSNRIQQLEERRNLPYQPNINLHWLPGP